jgi:hypothetical protein
MRRWHIVEVTKVEKNMFKITTPSDFMLKAWHPFGDSGASMLP